jgi:hypothetical protein
MPKHQAFTAESTKARAWYRRAYRQGAQAVTLYDLGIARGLLLALKRDGEIGKSTLDRMFKAILAAAPGHLVMQIPDEHVAHLGKRVVAPASLRTRRKRASRDVV